MLLRGPTVIAPLPRHTLHLLSTRNQGKVVRGIKRVENEEKLIYERFAIREGREKRKREVKKINIKWVKLWV